MASAARLSPETLKKRLDTGHLAPETPDGLKASIGKADDTPIPEEIDDPKTKP